MSTVPEHACAAATVIDATTDTTIDAITTDTTTIDTTTIDAIATNADALPLTIFTTTMDIPLLKLCIFTIGYFIEMVILKYANLCLVQSFTNNPTSMLLLILGIIVIIAALHVAAYFLLRAMKQYDMIGTRQFKIFMSQVTTIYFGMLFVILTIEYLWVDNSVPYQPITVCTNNVLVSIFPNVRTLMGGAILYGSLFVTSAFVFGSARGPLVVIFLSIIDLYAFYVVARIVTYDYNCNCNYDNYAIPISIVIVIILIALAVANVIACYRNMRMQIKINQLWDARHDV